MISHFHKTIFVHVPKCGGQSIEVAFLSDVGLNWETRAPLLLRPNDTYLLGPPRLAHLTAAEYMKYKYITEEHFQIYYKFAIVRDPFERVLSFYNYMGYKWGLNRFVNRWLPKQFSLKTEYLSEKNRYRGMYFFVRPQVDFIFNDTGEILVDDIFHLEDIDNCFLKIQKYTGLCTDLQHVNRSVKNKATIHDLSSQNKDVISNLYRDDFEFFNSGSR